MLSVESVRYQIARWVELVNHPVRIILHSGCEDYNLIELGHLTQELVAERPDQEVGSIFTVVHIVNERFVEVEH